MKYVRARLLHAVFNKSAQRTQERSIESTQFRVRDRKIPSVDSLGIGNRFTVV